MDFTFYSEHSGYRVPCGLSIREWRDYYSSGVILSYFVLFYFI